MDRDRPGHDVPGTAPDVSSHRSVFGGPLRKYLLLKQLLCTAQMTFLRVGAAWSCSGSAPCACPLLCSLGSRLCVFRMDRGAGTGAGTGPYHAQT